MKYSVYLLFGAVSSMALVMAAGLIVQPVKAAPAVVAVVFQSADALTGQDTFNFKSIGECKKFVESYLAEHKDAEIVSDCHKVKG